MLRGPPSTRSLWPPARGCMGKSGPVPQLSVRHRSRSIHGFLQCDCPPSAESFSVPCQIAAGVQPETPAEPATPGPVFTSVSPFAGVAALIISLGISDSPDFGHSSLDHSRGERVGGGDDMRAGLDLDDAAVSPGLGLEVAVHARVAPSRALSLFRLTDPFPATACSALATCSLMPRCASGSPRTPCPRRP